MEWVWQETGQSSTTKKSPRRTVQEKNKQIIISEKSIIKSEEGRVRKGVLEFRKYSKKDMKSVCENDKNVLFMKIKWKWNDDDYKQEESGFKRPTLCVKFAGGRRESKK